MINLLAWLLFGALAGLFAGRVAESHHHGIPWLLIVAGVMGAVIGGVVVLIFDSAPLHSFNVWSLVVALLGSALVIGAAHVATRGRF